MKKNSPTGANNEKDSPKSSYMVSSYPLFLFIHLNGVERGKTMKVTEEVKEAVKNYSEKYLSHSLVNMKCIYLNNTPTTS